MPGVARQALGPVVRPTGDAAMIARDASGILIEVDDPQDEKLAYRYFVYYGIYDRTQMTGDGSTEIFRTEPFSCFKDITNAAAIIPVKPGQKAMIQNFQLLAIKVNGTWRPA